MNPRDARGARLIESGGDANPSSMKLWNHVLALSDWDIVVDVGCNYGEMLLTADLPRRAEVLAFEPNSSVLPYLERSLREWGRPAELIRSAVAAEQAASAEFLRDMEWSGTSALANAGDGPANAASDRVRVTTLDAELGGRRTLNSACIKIDVEGSEDAVLAGAATVLDEFERWVVMVEILHMTPDAIARLAQRHPLYLQDHRTGGLVRILSRSPVMVRTLLESGWVYPQDAVLASAPPVVEG